MPLKINGNPKEIPQYPLNEHTTANLDCWTGPGQELRTARGSLTALVTNDTFWYREKQPWVKDGSYPNRQAAISIDRLKPAYILCEDSTQNHVDVTPADAAREAPVGSPQPTLRSHDSTNEPSSLTSASPPTRVTRSGRAIKPPACVTPRVGGAGASLAPAASRGRI
ncbi:unnamed protein product [Plutella xylostella]|uniref:(diamondback moth) hypothetical protein n=1 Tax=Plutella xylostella TaxID=51655 RepID=A0A8S4GCU4_PLUXY|nr:unnamed protein product [Plutella xylostella]